MTDLYDSFAEEMKIERLKLNLTMRELAKKTNLTSAAISKIENRQIKLMAHNLLAIAKALKMRNFMYRLLGEVL